MKRTQLEVGKKYGNLTFLGNFKHVDDKSLRPGSKRLLGEFSCDCGNITWKRLDQVNRGNTRSCGCRCPSMDFRQRQLDAGEDYPFHVLMNHVEGRSRKREIHFELTANDIKVQYLKQDGLCSYTKQKLTLPKNHLFMYEPDIVSIDRIDSDLGYTPENIQLVTKTINFMKQTLSHEEFVRMCTVVADNFRAAA